MPPKKFFINGAMFDVLPIDGSGGVDIAKITAPKVEINLASTKEIKKSISKSRSKLAQTVGKKDVKEYHRPEPVLASLTKSFFDNPETHLPKAIMLQELERSVSAQFDISGTLRSVGGVLRDTSGRTKPRYIPLLTSKTKSFDIQEKEILNEISHPLISDNAEKHSKRNERKSAYSERKFVEPSADTTPQVGEVERWLMHVKKEIREPSSEVSSERSYTTKRSRKGLYLKIVAVVSIIVVAVVWYTISARGYVIEYGGEAVVRLEQAKHYLEQLDFAAASREFAGAHEAFSQAASSMGVLRGILADAAGALPGGSSVKSASHIVEAGTLIAEAGKSISDAMDALGMTKWVLNPKSSARVLTTEIISPLRRALQDASEQIAEAEILLDGVDPSDLPEDKRELFLEFYAKMPELNKYLAQGVGYADFFENLVGTTGTHKYLLLFQNTSELRPAGGFPGTYGVVTFRDGRLVDFFADDVYNIDGQLKELFVPPLQLQHITPNWAMRDANWFADFPVSARKVMEFFEKEAGYSVDGILTINPKIMSVLLEATGPMAMPEYGVTVNAENFLPVVQSEVEYGDNKKINKPKKIITDMAPILLERLYTLENKKWLTVMEALLKGLEEKDILMFFSDSEMQEFITDRGFSGAINRDASDFIMVTFSNIKGSKTDAVTDSVISLSTSLQKADKTTHVLTIRRRHNGGDSSFGFYNKQNPSFVRVLVPKGAELISINGNSRPVYSPLMNYAKAGFQRDPELQAFENTMRYDSAGRGVTFFSEAGKAGFGFWMITDPGEIKTVELAYDVPRSGPSDVYDLYVQKQPGLNGVELSLTFESPRGVVIQSSTIPLSGAETRLLYEDEFTRDLPIQITFD